jgi:hypothetical protein
MDTTYWSMDECRWVTWTPGEASSPGDVDGETPMAAERLAEDPDAIPRQVAESPGAPVNT